MLDKQNPKQRHKQHNESKNLEEPQGKIFIKMDDRWLDL